MSAYVSIYIIPVQYCVIIVLIPSEFKFKSGSDLLDYWQIAKRNFKHRLYVHEKITYLILLIIMNLTYYSKEGVFQKGELYFPIS